MSFPRYPKYKDSGVEWLGEVPVHWKNAPLKSVSTHNDDVLDETTTPDAEIAYVDISSVDSVNGIKTKETMMFSAAPSRARRRVKHGDVIVSTVRTYLKAIARIREPEDNLIVSTGFAVIRPRGELTPDFLGHLVSASYFVDQVIARSTGVSYPAINASELVAIPVTVPPIADQTQIAAFLDSETAKIDALVAEQRRLMELLKEKRQAVISHAVTKGLNPNAPMKPSGIEWLGDVPAHWEVKRIKLVTESVKAGPFGSALTKDVYVGAGYRVYGQEQVIPNDFTIGDYFITPEKYEELSQYKVSPGDILISCVGTFGKIAIVPNSIEPGIINPRLIRLRCSKAIIAEYLVEVMRSIVTFEQFASFTRGGTMDVINIGTLNEIFVALPPTEEQEGLLNFIRSKIAKFDTLTAEAQRAIDLLQERRTALISAAVTGQIDVRNTVTA